MHVLQKAAAMFTQKNGTQQIRNTPMMIPVKYRITSSYFVDVHLILLSIILLFLGQICYLINIVELADLDEKYYRYSFEI